MALVWVCHGAARHILPHLIVRRPRRTCCMIFNLLYKLLQVLRLFPADLVISKAFPFDQVLFSLLFLHTNSSFGKDFFWFSAAASLNADVVPGRLVARWIFWIFMIRLEVADVQDRVYLHP
uniref:Uncharacterized protein n=1 Tax=Cannabis sativa TaxID=3483 RepID=A0A803RB54_CANSA